MMLRRCLRLFLFALAIGATPAVACDLQSKNRNPADVPGIKFSQLASRVNETFTAGGGSQRYYDHVEPLDGITIGFGHWPQAEVSKFFRDMRDENSGKALAAFTDCATAFFALKRETTQTKSRIVCDKIRSESTAGVWRQAQKAAGIVPGNLTRARVAEVLDRTLLSDKFNKEFGRNCRRDSKHRCLPNQPNLFRKHGKWLAPLLCYALRDRVVIDWQVDFWSRDIINDAVKLAEQIGLEDDEAAVVAAAAYDSSAPAWFRDVIEAAKTGHLSRNGYRWNWNDPPHGAKKDSEGLKAWRRFILWQYYAVRVWPGRHKIRDRSIKFFELYLADDWILPGLDRDGKPLAKDQRNLNPALVKPRS